MPAPKRIAGWFVVGETRLCASGAGAYVPIGVVGVTGLKCKAGGLDGHVSNVVGRRQCAEADGHAFAGINR